MRYFTLFCLLILLSSQVLAQDAEPIHPPLAAESVLSDSVELLEIMPLWYVGSEVLLINDEGTQAWEAIEYPATAPIMSFFPLDDGRYLLRLGGVHGFETLDPEYTWIFDPETQEFSNPEALCRAFTNIGTDYWVSSSFVYYLYPCEASQEAQLPFSGYGEVIGESSDGNWLFFAAGQFAAYNTQTGEFLEMSETIPPANECCESYTITEASEMRYFIEVRQQGTNGTERMLYDVNLEAGTWTQLFLGEGNWGERILVRYNDGYEWLNEDCSISALSFETGEIENFSIPELCQLAWRIPTNTMNYLATTDDGMLIQYSRETGEIVKEYNNSFPYILSIMADNPGKVLLTTSEEYDPRPTYWQMMSIDDSQPYYAAVGYPPVWLNENDFVWSTREDNLFIVRPPIRYMSPDDLRREREILLGRALTGPVYSVENYGEEITDYGVHGSFVPVWTDNDTLSLYNADTESMTSILTVPHIELMNKGYTASIEWQEDDSLIVTVFYSSAFQPLEIQGSLPVGRWHIRLLHQVTSES